VKKFKQHFFDNDSVSFANISRRGVSEIIRREPAAFWKTCKK